MSAYCKKCYNEKNEQWRKNNPEAYVRSQRNTRRKWQYGIDSDHFYKILDEQGGKCAICKTVVDESAHIDHCHDTGTIRGILCRNCNVGIGMLQDSVEIIGSAVEYLSK